MNRAALCLAVLTAASFGSAQNIGAEEYLSLASRPDGYSLLRTTVRRTARAYGGDLVVRVVTSWPYSETRTVVALRVPAMAQRTVLVPVPLPPNDSYSVSLEGELGAMSGSAGSSASPSHGAEATFMAVAGLGERVVYDITQFATGTDLIAGAVRTGSDPGEVSLPTVPSAWGGVHVVLAGTEALMRATPEARRALSQWVAFGGVLAISARSAADLRDPWITSMMGAVQQNPSGSWSYEQTSSASPEGVALRSSGLGSVMVLPMDLSISTWNSNPDVTANFRSIVRNLNGAGGGVVAPGDLGLFRKTLENGDPQSVLRPYVNLRPVLLPIAGLLTLYIVVVGLMLGRRGARKEPLKRLMQLPVLSLGVLGLVVAISHLSRSGVSTARVIALYDMASGSPVALRRVFAGLTAGGSRTFDLASPDGTLAVFRAGSSAANGVLRWDGARVSIERARLGLFETGVYYAEGAVDTGEGMSVTTGEDGVPLLVNRTNFRVIEARYDDGARGLIWELGAAAPGQSVRASGSRAPTQGSGCNRLWGAGRWATVYGSRGTRAEMHRVLFDQMLADPRPGHEVGFLWALVALPDDVRRMMAGFAVDRAMALVRVVARSARGESSGVARSRIGVRTYYSDTVEPAAAVVPSGTVGLRDAEASQ